MTTSWAEYQIFYSHTATRSTLQEQTQSNKHTATHTHSLWTAVQTQALSNTHNPKAALLTLRYAAFLNVSSFLDQKWSTHIQIPRLPLSQPDTTSITIQSTIIQIPSISAAMHPLGALIILFLSHSIPSLQISRPFRCIPPHSILIDS